MALNFLLLKFNRQNNFDATIDIYERGTMAGIQRDTMMDNALIEAYCKSGKTEEARKVFDNMNFRDTNTLNTMLIGYNDKDQFDEALRLFENCDGITKDAITHSAALEAYSEVRPRKPRRIDRQQYNHFMPVD